MFATAGGPSCAGSPLTWSLFFARQPEPDLEFTEEELEQTANVRSSSPMKSPKNKKSGGSPLLWILLLVLIGGGAYVAMEPEMVMDVVGPLLGETTEPPPPPIARRPPPPAPQVPSTPQAQPGPSATAPAAPPAESPQAAVPAPAPEPTTAPAPPASASPMAPMAPPPSAEALPPITDSPTPVYAEGQRVTLLPTPGAPREKVALMRDAEGTKPGPAVPPGTNFTILDGDLQDHGWVYYVRSDYGTKGWLNENQLKAKP